MDQYYFGNCQSAHTAIVKTKGLLIKDPWKKEPKVWAFELTPYSSNPELFAKAW